MNRNLKDKKIIIYQQINTGKPGGIPVLGYKPIHPGKLWAYVRQLSEKELYYSSGKYTQETMIFEINWRNMRPNIIRLEPCIEYRGIFYEVRRIDTFEGYKDFLKITASELLKQPDPENIYPYDK